MEKWTEERSAACIFPEHCLRGILLPSFLYHIQRILNYVITSSCFVALLLARWTKSWEPLLHQKINRKWCSHNPHEFTTSYVRVPSSYLDWQPGKRRHSLWTSKATRRFHSLLWTTERGRKGRWLRTMNRVYNSNMDLRRLAICAIFISQESKK